MNSLTILITGGAGFVGANLVKYLLEKEVARIHVVDNLLSSERFSLPADSRVRFSEKSITDDDLLRRLEDEYDYVFHLSTYHGNQSSIHDPLADHENNTLTTLKLCERIKSFKKIKKVVYSSAGCSVAKKTFDKAEASQEVDFVSLHMDSPYSMSKIFGEFYSVYYFEKLGLPTVRTRFQNVYGPGEVLGAGRWRGTPATVWRNVIPTFVYQALKKQPLRVDNGGIATRDFIFVDDIVEGLVLCALHGTPGDVYNLATGTEMSILELAKKINAVTGNPTPIEFTPKRSWDNSGHRFGATEKAEKQLGFRAKVSLDSGLQRTVDWTVQNLPLIDKAISKHAALYR